MLVDGVLVGDATFFDVHGGCRWQGGRRIFSKRATEWPATLTTLGIVVSDIPIVDTVHVDFGARVAHVDFPAPWDDAGGPPVHGGTHEYTKVVSQVVEELEPHWVRAVEHDCCGQGPEVDNVGHAGIKVLPGDL